ncbi:GPI mannosyltransferase 3-like [Neodiprion fabricii]|uniref:GPI mannosyltransferase 3-like n=1 Tax=Neodiprion fabricii TaxID=2872261 RepID=UPI001ED931B1|nr:GPI mannosyltransferase 3-like [Neodiprion fabricii]XP_046419585.1 GPI mannosyltransferase 3-like [Neodiprion fabricii]XP_046419586.1 GPI mannosyltransferase 3-like [Neodiprion fabricii]XP_046419587.1 GPI mannosyltransferase 3-like [Neodiprion fabricii]XP_046419589.1 GPI mannosyltransferase 3-like [Neodiprion fabricii]
MNLSNRIHKVLLCVIAWRLSSVFLVQTSDVPDEYWQSMEVAHRLAFGYGHLTWEWREGIRSYIYPLLISLIYRILGFFHLDFATLIIIAPRIIQALLSAYADYRFYVWTKNKWALFSLCTNWFWYYYASRTLVNTLETSLTTITLSIFPWRDSNTKSVSYIWIVAWLCVVRPTAAVIWTPLCLYHLLTTPTSGRIVLLLSYLRIGMTTSSIATLVDTIGYGKFVLSHIEFLRINLIYRVSDFYGTEPFFWYLTIGIPVILGLYYVIFLIGAWQVVQHPAKFHRQAVMLVVIGWTLAIYSMIPHKEIRFILPLLPFFVCLGTSGILCIKNSVAPFTRTVLMTVLVLTNLLPGLYFSLVHLRGSLDAMKILRQEIASVPNDDVNILFLTPCHATPFYSHLHANVTARFLTCEPSLSNRDDYIDEASEFFANPNLWLRQTYSNTKDTEMPTHLVLFHELAPSIHQFLDKYRLIADLFYAHITPTNYSQYLLIYKRK